MEKRDTKSSERKADHIRLALESQLRTSDSRFYYEPLLSAHPSGDLEPVDFSGQTLKAPIWISSMTGGTEMAGEINRSLAKAAGKYGLGMGLGSCRMLLDDDTYLKDFQLRKYIGDQHPLYANLGIAQVQTIINQGRIQSIVDLIDKTETNGLIVHVNPFQEWLQPEGDLILESPIDTLTSLLNKIDIKVIVKEVGQGMGPDSLRALISLPIAAIDFAAFGGTNFSRMEMARETNAHPSYDELVYIGHDVSEMIGFYNNLLADSSNSCPMAILSGGIKSFLDGYYGIQKVNGPAIYGQASPFLKKALEGQEELEQHIEKEIAGYQLAEKFLRVK